MVFRASGPLKKPLLFFRAPPKAGLSFPKKDKTMFFGTKNRHFGTKCSFFEEKDGALAPFTQNLNFKRENSCFPN